MKPHYNLLDELMWRGMVQDAMPGTRELLEEKCISGYIGFDPTADSLHVGHLVQIMLLMHLQRAGHSPIALVGGATGMVGDPSGKSQERNLLDAETLAKNVAGVEQQLRKFLAFGEGQGKAKLTNNYDWFEHMGFIDFIRDVGKHISVNYMMAKDSVKKRLETGLSFTEFTYQLLQGYDFYYLFTHHQCQLQMGGADQWGNMTTGTELIRRKAGGEAFAFTTPLITKADGTKFGKTEKGAVWLDASRTSPYEFYQFWLRTTDVDAAKYIRIFTFLAKDEIEALEAQHAEAPHALGLQKALAMEITARVHGEEALALALTTTDFLFGKGTTEQLKSFSRTEILQVFQGVPVHPVQMSIFTETSDLAELLAVHTPVFPSKGEARRMLQANGVSINKEKVSPDWKPSPQDLLQDQYLLVQKGKKEYHLLIIKDHA
jgi:tyrosyl-tRNA synthetase